MFNWLKNLSSGTDPDLQSANISGIPTASVIPRDHHSISRKWISDNALKVMQRLNRSGHKAFLVGGAVRDLLLGEHPKDFDVATDATPEQVRALFSNSRIIGRRFQIVHVRYGKEVIEVTTFRGHHPDEDKPRARNNQQSSRSAEGMLLRDNVYGTVEEDAIRRDFTVNALYYSSADFTVLDYCCGLQDLHDRTIRLIGDPEKRYREDPVRMLRAIRFAAKLNFSIHDETAAPLVALGDLLYSIPAARLFDETLKLFMSGYGLKTYHLLRQYQLLPKLFPQSEQMIHEQAYAEALFIEALKSTDLRIKEGKPVTPAFLYAAFLWPSIKKEMLAIQQDRGFDPMSAFHEAANQVVRQQQEHTSLPRRYQIIAREMWELQLRLPNNGGRRAQRLHEHIRFRAAYDFLLLREQAGEIEPGLGKWWTEYQLQHSDRLQEQKPQRNYRKRPANNRRGTRNNSHKPNRIR
jgi:poly(A) polymerase